MAQPPLATSGGLRAAADMPLAKLGAGSVPAGVWRALGWALIASAASDGLIALAYAGGREDWAGWLIAASSSLALMLLGLPRATSK